MSMSVGRRVSAFLTLFSFLVLLCADVFPQAAAPAQSEFQNALEAGKKLYESGEHKDAIIRLSNALTLAKGKEEISESYFYMALCYYALGEQDSCIGCLKKVFEADPVKDIDTRLFPLRFVGLFNQTRDIVVRAAPAKPEIKAEEKKIEAEKKAEPEKKTEPQKKEEKKADAAKKVEPPKIEEKKEPDKKVEKKPEEQRPPAAAGRGKQEIPAKKKGKFPWLIAGGVAVAGGVAAIFLMKKETAAAPTIGNIAITSTPTGAKVFLDGTDTGQATNCALTNIAVGTHILKLVLDYYGMWEGSIQVVGGQTASVTATLSAYTYEFVTKWGSLGSGDGQFNYPVGIVVDSTGYIYIADGWNSRIQKFTSNGAFIIKWGSQGNGDGQFTHPHEIALDSSGNVYVADRDNHRIQKFTPGGVFMTKWGGLGNGDGQFNNPYGIAVDSSGNVYVADCLNHRIEKFTSGGAFMMRWGSQGNGDGQFYFPRGIAASSSGTVYVADGWNNRIQKFTSGGAFMIKWGNLGSDDGQFNNPAGIAVDSSGYVYVSDWDNHRIQKFTSGGALIMKWGNLGSGDGQFNNPDGITVDSSGYVYVVDRENHRIQKFRPKAASPLPARITYTSLRGEALREDSARQLEFFSDPRTTMPFGFSRVHDIINIRQAPPIGFFKSPGSPDGFLRMPGMPGSQIISPRGINGLPDVSNKFGEIPQKVTSAAVSGSSVAQKTKKG